MPLPRGGSQIFGASATVHVAHELQADHASDIVMARFNVAHGSQNGHRARGAGRLVT